MKKIILLLVMVFGVIPVMWAGISIQTKVFDANSQPPIVGGMIDDYSDGSVMMKGIIVSTNADNLDYDASQEVSSPRFYEDKTKSEAANNLYSNKNYRIIDCTGIGREQFWCTLKLLEGNSKYFIRAFAIPNNGAVAYGETLEIVTKNFSRYNDSFDKANVWHAFDSTLFDLVTDEITDPNDGFYYSTNENPTRVSHQVGTGYNTCYKFLTEWNYKLWYYHSAHCNQDKVVNTPIMTFSDNKLFMEKNPIDADKDITIYYSINGNYFRPESYTDVYTAPIEITEPCTVYCYAISSEGYISYTNMYVVENIANEISVQTKIYDANSQPMLVGGFIENYSKKNVSKKGIIVSKHNDDLVITEETDFHYADVLLKGKDGVSVGKPYDIRFIDCTDTNEEQFACLLQYLEGNTDYYVRAFVINVSNKVIYGSTEKLHTKDYKRYGGDADYGNVWYAFDHTLFDLSTDEIIDPNNGFYYSTNENPTRFGHQVGTGYNTCYKFLTEWNYKLWYSQLFCWDGSPKKEGKSVHIPVMKYADGLLTINKNPLDADKDITIYYSINGNYFRPENYKDVYSQPLSITEPCAVYCYAISSDGYISYTNIYVIGDYTIKNEDDNSSDFGTVADVVDLGLSVKWASWNIGASSVGDYGGLYGAGDPTGLKRSTSYADYYWKDGESICGTEYDLAHVKWGGNWRMPSWKELEELQTKCEWSDGEVDGVKGCWVKGPNGNSIFLPWSGNRKGTSTFSDKGIIGYYWSGDMGVSLHSYGYKDLDIKSGGVFQTDGAENYWGQSIRPIYVGDVQQTESVIIAEIGKTTYCSEFDLDFTNVAGIKAYIAIGYDDIDKTIWLARVMKVPAGTGLLLKGDAGTYKIPHANVRSTYVNYLKGNLGEAIKIEETDGDKTNYYLSGKDGTFVSVNGNANIGKNKAYLQLPTSIFAGTRSIGISYNDEDGTTGIKDVKSSNMKDGEWYTLQGQRVAKPGKGLYIRNGKKVVIK